MNYKGEMTLKCRACNNESENETCSSQCRNIMEQARDRIMQQNSLFDVIANKVVSRKPKKEEKIVIMVKCKNDLCTEEIEKHHRRKYCSDECRNAQNQRDHRERILIESGEYEESKKQALIMSGNKKNIVIDPKWLRRGTLSSVSKQSDTSGAFIY